MKSLFGTGRSPGISGFHTHVAHATLILTILEMRKVILTTLVSLTIMISVHLVNDSNDIGCGMFRICSVADEMIVTTLMMMMMIMMVLEETLSYNHDDDGIGGNAIIKS